MDPYQLQPPFSIDFDNLGQGGGDDEDAFATQSSLTSNRLADGAFSPITLNRLEAAWKEEAVSPPTAFTSSASPQRLRYGPNAASYGAHRRTPTFSAEVNEGDFDFFSTPSSSRTTKSHGNVKRETSPTPISASSASTSASQLPSSTAPFSLAATTQTTPRRKRDCNTSTTSTANTVSLSDDARPVLMTSSSGQATLLTLPQGKTVQSTSDTGLDLSQDAPSSPPKRPFSFEDAQRQHALMMSQAKQRAIAAIHSFQSSTPSASANLSKRGLFHQGAGQSKGGMTTRGSEQQFLDALQEEAGHPTPLATSQGVFGDHRPTLSSSATPATPLSGMRRYGHVHNDSTSGSSLSGTTTPDQGDDYQSPLYAVNLTPGSSAFGFAGAGTFGRVPLQRGQSLQSFSQHLNGSNHQLQTFSAPLDSFWSYGGQDEPQIAEGALTPGGHHPHHQQQPKMSAYGHGYSASEQLQSPPGGLSLFHRRAQQSAMSRVASAPALASMTLPPSSSAPNLPQHHQSPSQYDTWREDSVPTTPGSTVSSWTATSSIPGTPGELAGLTLSSPGFVGAGNMTQSRSMGALAASTANMSPFYTPSRPPAQHYAGAGEDYSFPSTGGHVADGNGHGPTKQVKKNGRSHSRSSIATTPRKHTSSRSQSSIMSGGTSGSPPAPPLVVSSADKLHVCHCGKRFKRMEHLKRHNRTHTQERPHKCPVEGCGKYFGRTDNLSQHLKTHFRASGLARASQHLLAMSARQGNEQQLDMRHDPHAAAAEAARAALKAAAGARNGGAVGVDGRAAVAGGGESDSSSGSPPSGDEAQESSGMLLGGPISFGGGGGKQQDFSPPAQHYHQHQQHPHDPFSYNPQQMGGQFARQVLVETNGANAHMQGQAERDDGLNSSVVGGGRGGVGSGTF